MSTPASGQLTTSGTAKVLSAAIFAVEAKGALTTTAYFAELGGIVSEVESTEYIMGGGPQNTVLHSRQFGKTKPPTVTLKRGVDGTGEIWDWHRKVRHGDDSARVTATLTMYMPDGTTKAGTYTLTRCWPTKVDISGAKAGSGEVVYETVTLTCDEIDGPDPKTA